LLKPSSKLPKVLADNVGRTERDLREERLSCSHDCYDGLEELLSPCRMRLF
jgi:hypothetical protein